MDVLNTLLPVFAMMALGLLSRKKNWVTPEQKDGLNNIIFSILFPILIFHIIFTSTMHVKMIGMMSYVLIGWTLVFVIAHFLTPFLGKEYAHIAPYLLTCVEGGNVALPLYLSIVGSAYAMNTVTFDMAGTILAFMIFPVVIAKRTSGNVDVKSVIKQIFSSSFVIAVLSGLVLNLLGVHRLLSQTAFDSVYTSTMSMLTTPITGMILFMLGFDLKLEKDTLRSLGKLMFVKFLVGIVMEIGMFLLFPLTKEMQLAVLLYFMCPSGFAMPAIISPLYQNEKDKSFVSSFISLYMIITLIVYTGLVIFFR